MKVRDLEERRIRSFDGTELAYHVAGEGKPVLLCNGLGGSWMAWSHQIAYFQDRYRFISWDYRGLYRSAAPPSHDALRVEDHACDALAILDAEGIEAVAIWGWSMGVQLALELHRRARERIAALVLINGVAGDPWHTVLNAPALKEILPGLIRGAARVSGVAEALTRRLAAQPETVQWIKRMGLASPALDDALFNELAASFRELDMKIYLRTLELLGEHDATAQLGLIRIPVLVIAGARDRLTPRRAAEQMVARIDDAELMVVPGGTHYVAVEYPELVSLRIEKFLREHGY